MSEKHALGDGESMSDRPQLVYTADPEAKHKRFIDVEASLKRLSLTREQLMARTWAKGSPQHRLKGAAAYKSARAPRPARASNGLSPPS
jgi:hypothetical protein